jgi:hypothetical protein
MLPGKAIGKRSLTVTDEELFVCDTVEPAGRKKEKKSK